MTRPTRSLRGLLLATVMLVPIVAAAQDGGDARSFRESVTLDTDGTVLKRLAAVRDFVAEERWDEAVAILDEVAAANPETLVPVSPGRYLPAAAYCDLVLAGLPPEGLAVYRRRADPQARQWFETAHDRRDDALLERVARRAFCSSYGDDALLALGDWAWERGATALARQRWQQILPPSDPAAPGEPLSELRYPDSDLDPAPILARIALAHLVEGDVRQAETVAARLSADFPDAHGELAGRSGRLTDILAAVTQEAGNWTSHERDAAVSTFALNARRNQVLPAAVDVGSLRWPSLPLPDPMPGWKRVEHPARMLDRRPLSYHPVLLGTMLLLCDANRIYALDLLTGRPWYDGLEAPAEGSLDAAEIFQTAAPAVEPAQPVIGVPHFTLTLDEGRLYARTGSPITSPASIGKTLESDLICFDPVLHEGKLIWRVSASDVEPGWTFEGAPVVADGRAYVALRRGQPQTQAAVGCFDAETGRLLWKRDVCAAVQRADANFNVVTNHLLTLAEDMVYFSTDLGAVAALDARDGTIRWVVTYESLPETDPVLLADPLRQGLTPCLVHGDLVVAAPADAQEVMAIDAATGVIRWRTWLPERIRHVLGVGQDRVIVSGDSLWGLDVKTGERVWGSERRAPESFGYGRGILVEDVVYWPTRDAIHVLDQRTGRPPAADRVPIPLSPKGVVSGGNLLIAEGHLIVASADRLYVLDEQSRARPPERLTAGEADSAVDWYERARQAEIDGDAETAIDGYRRAAKAASDGDRIDERPLRLAAQTRLYRLLTTDGQALLAAGDAQRAARRFEDAASFAPDLDSEVTALLRVAAAHADRGDFVAEAAIWERILAEPRLADCRVARIGLDRGLAANRPGTTLRSARLIAAERLAYLIDRYGRRWMTESESAARSAFESAAAAEDPEALRDVALRWPHARARDDCLLAAAEILRQREEWIAAACVFEEVASGEATSEARELALRGAAEAWEGAGYWNLAELRWRSWAESSPDVTILANGQPRSATQHVAERLGAREYAPAVIGPPLRRTWHRTLSQASTIIEPSGRPPSSRHGCLLLNDGGLHCIDAASGQTRWTIWTQSRVTWATFIGPHLVLGTESGALQAVSPDDGRTRWEYDSVASPDDGTPGWHEWRVFGMRIGCLRDGRHLILLDGWTGRPIWEFRVSTGRLQRRWYCDEELVAVQTLGPGQTVILSSVDGRLLGYRDGDPVPWLRDPVRSGTDALAVVTGNKGVRSFQKDGAPLWTYDGPLSHARVDPVLLDARGRLLLVVDGDTLAELDPATGHRRWSRVLADGSIPEPSTMLATDEGQILVAENGIVRAISLSDGGLRWENYVAPASGACRPRVEGRWLFVAPGTSDESQPLLQIVHAETGRPAQVIPIENAAAAEVQLFLQSASAILRADHSLVAWTPRGDDSSRSDELRR